MGECSFVVLMLRRAGESTGATRCSHRPGVGEQSEKNCGQINDGHQQKEKNLHGTLKSLNGPFIP